MNFAAPLNLLWLIPSWGIITVLYLLRRPRKNVDVPSTQFWRSVPQESARRAKIQKFTPQLLWALQMLAALALILSLMQPQFRTDLGNGAAIALIIDNGITSSATDISGSRLNAEKEAALSLLSDSSLGHSTITIIKTTPAGIIGQSGMSVTDAKNSIGNIQPSDEKSDIVSAVTAANSVLKSTAKFGQQQRIMMLSDMAWDNKLDNDVRSAAGQIPISADRQGVNFASSSPSDTAITRLSAQRSSADPENTLDVYIEISTTLQSQSGQLILSSDTMTLITKHFQATNTAPASISFEIPAPKVQSVLTAKLQLADGSTDQIADDNYAYIILPSAGGLHVLLISDTKSSLDKALSLLPGVNVKTISSTDYESGQGAGNFDVTIFNSVQPDPKIPASGGELVWGGGDKSFTSDTDTPGWSQIADWDHSNPVLRFTDFSSTSLKGNTWNRIGNWSPLIETQQGIVCASSELGGDRKIWMSLDLNGSGFDSSPAFPIFVSNCVSWLSEAENATANETGNPIILPRAQGGWSVKGPGISLSGICSDSGSGCSVTNTEMAGVYTADNGSQTITFVRNCPASSIDLTPKDHTFLAGSSSGNAEKAGNKYTNWQPEIGLAIALCMLILIGEWIAFHKPLAKQRA
jgi:hypothetical protein